MACPDGRRGALVMPGRLPVRPCRNRDGRPHVLRVAEARCYYCNDAAGELERLAAALVDALATTCELEALGAADDVPRYYLDHAERLATLLRAVVGTRRLELAAVPS